MNGAKNYVSVADFLRSWMNDPIPHHIIDTGAEVVEMDDYTPEKRAHQIVKRCVAAWIENKQDAMPAPPTPELPNAAQREAGTRWLEMYGDHPDKAFVAAAVWRVMWMARHEPKALGSE